MIDNLKTKVNNYLANGKIQEALDFIISCNLNNSTLNNFLLLSGQYRHLKDNEMMMTQEMMRREQAKIMKSIQWFTNQMSDTDIHAMPNQTPAPPTTHLPRQRPASANQ